LSSSFASRHISTRTAPVIAYFIQYRAVRKEKVGGGGAMNSVNYTHHLFFSSGWRTNSNVRTSVNYLFLSPAGEERKKKPTNLAGGRCFVCLLPYSHLPLTLLGITLQDFLFYIVRKNPVEMIKNKE
jgi:hypothetical protein